MPVNDALGTRMKEFYEQIPKTRLMHRTPVAIRIDGKAFHTFTRGFQKPFDEILMKSMQETTKYLCENIQGCVFGYTQSDEITLILVDYQKLDTSAWFDYEVQKMCSISASMATLAFNRSFSHNVREFLKSSLKDIIEAKTEDEERLIVEYRDVLKKAVEKGAMFDARCFNIPKEEVTNLIYWRQLDATRNSIQMVGQANFSHKELHGKTCNMIQDMLHEQKGINWNDYPTVCKRGTACIKVTTIDEMHINALGVEESFGQSVRSTICKSHSEWIIDKEMPILKGKDRAYVDDLIFVGEGIC